MTVESVFSKQRSTIVWRSGVIGFQLGFPWRDIENKISEIAAEGLTEYWEDSTSGEWQQRYTRVNELVFLERLCTYMNERFNPTIKFECLQK